MLVNKGSNTSSSEQIINLGQLNIFLLYMFIKFGDWYYSKETNQQSKKIDINKPNLSIMNKDIGDNTIGSDSNNTKSNLNICPMCSLSFTNPVTISCCGVVYCNNCLVRYMKTNKACFNCKNKISNSNVIKIYK